MSSKTLQILESWDLLILTLPDPPLATSPYPNRSLPFACTALEKVLNLLNLGVVQVYSDLL